MESENSQCECRCQGRSGNNRPQFPSSTTITTGDKSNKRLLSKILRRFCERTSMQGVPYIQSSRRSIAKFTWSILSVAAIVLLTWHLYSLVSIYYNNGKHTSVSVGFDRLRFPAVTICNVNPVRKSKLNDTSSAFYEFISKLDPDTRLREMEQYLNETGYNRSRTNTFGNFLNYTFTHYRDNNSDVSLLARISAEFKHLYGQLNIGKRIHAGHKIRSMLYECHFASSRCQSMNFAVATNVDYGNCFTIQSNEYISARSGPDGGLQMILFLETHEYLPGYTNSKGLVASIHTAETYPFPQEDGIALSAGMESFIGLTMMRIKRLPKPYGDCHNNQGYFSKAPLTYTRRFCQARCREELIMDSCHCYDARQMDIIYFHGFQQYYNMCTSWNELKCLDTLEKSWIKGDLHCPCKSECYEEYLKFSLSARPWPSQSYLQLLVSDACLTLSKEDCAYVKGLEKDNFIKINIFYADLNYQNITELPAYDAIKFVSDIGGTAGLWIGVSILSFFEIIQLLIELVMYCVYGHWKFLTSQHVPKLHLNTLKRNVYVVDDSGQSRGMHVSDSHTQVYTSNGSNMNNNS